MIEDLKQEHFNLKLEGTLEDYLSCEITFNDDETVGWIHQPHLITKLGIVLRNPGSVVDEEKHALHRTGVGMLLCLVKHTRPDIANVVHELSKALGSPSPAAFKTLLWLIKFASNLKQSL